MKHPQPASTGTPGKTVRKAPARAKARADTAAPAHTAPDDSRRDEMIRQTAYAFYVARGCVAGYELDDWLQAEAQVSAALAPPAQASQSSPPALQTA